MDSPTPRPLPDPPRAPAPGRIHAADWLLRIAIFLHALGFARALFTRAGSSLGSIALLEWEVPHATILAAEKAGSAILLAAAASVLLRPTAAVLAVIAAAILTECLAGVRAGGFHFSDFTPLTRALRYLAPLALLALVVRNGSRAAGRRRCRIAGWILRIGLAAVFASHGYEAWKLHPGFVDFVIVGARDLAGFDLTESAATPVLKTIAVIDFVVAAWVLVRPSRILLGWLCFWGLVTALARPLTLGAMAYPDVLLRASHVLAPLAVWLLLPARRGAAEDDPPSENPETPAAPRPPDARPAREKPGQRLPGPTSPD
jgi:hypothetical protein